jgi:hypothetical protein
MTALITPAQLASRLRVPEATLDAVSAQDACDHATGLVRGVAAQEISFVAQETIELPGGERLLRLPQRPVVVDGTNPLTVVEVGEYGGIDVTMVEHRDYTRIGADLTRGWPWWYGGSQRIQGWPYTRLTGVWAPKVRVTYSHGYVVIPDHATSIVLDVAAVLYSNPKQLRSITIDDYSETRASEVLGANLVASIGLKLAEVGLRRRAFAIRTV